MQTLLVTGAEGFAGRYLIAHLQQAGYEVVAGVRNRARKLAHERQNGKALVCDVTDAISVARVVASVRPDALVHLAGLARPSDAADEPLEAYQSIVTSWANVLDAVRRTVPRAKIVMASACDVYGDAGSTGQPLREDTPTQPISTFGSLKRAAESIAQTFFRDYHLNVTIARPFHYTGAGQSERFIYGAIAHRLAENESKSDFTELWLPDLDCRRDLLHVQDVAAAYERLLVDGVPNEAYNICSGQALSLREIAGLIAGAFGRQLQLCDLPTPENEVQIAALQGDNAKLRELGWSPQHTPQDAVRDLVAGYRAAQPVGKPQTAAV
ncbi:MAG: NAD-dependent epimerase/dehydratase family protein [Planctomycetota bacterium]